jgi:hypothetical protein
MAGFNPITEAMIESRNCPKVTFSCMLAIS